MQHKWDRIPAGPRDAVGEHGLLDERCISSLNRPVNQLDDVVRLWRHGTAQARRLAARLLLDLVRHWLPLDDGRERVQIELFCPVKLFRSVPRHRLLLVKDWRGGMRVKCRERHRTGDVMRAWLNQIIEDN
jgi:hypothetical protein